MSKPPPAPLLSQKKPAIRAGVFVEGPYGPITSPSTKSRANLRGVVLKGHASKGQWLVQWLSLGKVAAIPTGRIKVISGDNTINLIHIENFLQDLDRNFIGNQVDLQKYVDNQGTPSFKKRTTSTDPVVTPSPTKVARSSSSPPEEVGKSMLSFGSTMAAFHHCTDSLTLPHHPHHDSCTP